MFMCIIFAYSKVIKVIPQSWVQNNVEQLIFRTNETHKIFFSSSPNAISNFELPLSNTFDDSEERCYDGYILKKHASRTVVEDYMKKRRRILPPIYYPRRNYAQRRPRAQRPNHQPNCEGNSQRAAVIVQHEEDEHEPNANDAYVVASREEFQTNSTVQHKAIKVPELNEVNLELAATDVPNGVIDEPIESEKEEVTPSLELVVIQSQQQNSAIQMIQVSGLIEVNSQKASSAIQDQAIDSDAAAVVNRELSIVQSPQHSSIGRRQLIQAPDLNKNIEDSAANGKLIDTQHIGDSDLLLAKREKEIQCLRKAVNYLNDRLGDEDLTVQLMREHGNMLLSSADESDDSEDVDEENVPQNVQNVKLTDMAFSFSHQYILNEKKGREYQESHIEIQDQTIKFLKSLNSNKTLRTMVGDAKYIEALLKGIFKFGTLKIGTYESLSRAKIMFIKDLFMARLQNHKDGRQRLERFSELVNTVCSKLRSH